RVGVLGDGVVNASDACGRRLRIASGRGGMARRQRVPDATDDGAGLVESRVVLFASGPVERDLTATVEERRGLEAEEGTLDLARENPIGKTGRMGPEDEAMTELSRALFAPCFSPRSRHDDLA